MSTKLHYGVRYPASTGAEHYARLLHRAVTPVHERLVAEAAGRLLHAAVWAKLTGENTHTALAFDDKLIAELADELEFSETDTAPAAFDFFVPTERILKAIADCDIRCDPNLGLELSVVFCSDPAGGPWGYAYPFATNDTLRGILATLDADIEDYAYWNNTDRPENVTEDEWNERAATWDRIVGRNTFSEIGVQYTPPLPSVFMLSVNRRRWFLTAAAKGFAAAEQERVNQRAHARTSAARALIAGILTRTGKPTTEDDVAASQQRDDEALAAHFR